MDPTSWTSHQWIDARGRKVELEGHALLQYHCLRCLRDFVEEPTTGERYAVHVGIMHFDKLATRVSSLWLSELCPGQGYEKIFPEHRSDSTNALSDFLENLAAK
jgi:hypothetical protein